MQQLGKVVGEADGNQCQAGVGGGREGGAVERYRVWSKGGVLENAREVVGDFAGVFV